MFWGCFSWHRKNLCHIWKKEIAKERKQIDEELKKINAELKSEVKLKWELANDMNRMSLWNKRDWKSTWRWNEDYEKMIRKEKKGGIDWYLYQKKILIFKLLKFVKEHKINFLNTQMQKNKTFNHNSKYQNQIWMNVDILRFIWLENSSDLNMIKSCWFWMKRFIIRKEASRTRVTIEKAWINCWWKKLQQH